MYQYIEQVLAPRTFLFKIKKDDQYLSFRKVLELWEQDAQFRLFYTQILREAPFMGFFWVHPPIIAASLDQIYEFVLVGTEAFKGKTADKTAFSQYFSPNQLTTSFGNLRNDAQLIVPCPANSTSETYIHLAAFIRNAQNSQIHDFWQQVSLSIQQKLSNTLLWVSTSGLGVHWLHVRLDQRPKYYSHQPYKSAIQS